MPNPYPQCPKCTNLYNSQEAIRQRAKLREDEGKFLRSAGKLEQAESAFKEARALIEEADEIHNNMLQCAGNNHR